MFTYPGNVNAKKTNKSLTAAGKLTQAKANSTYTDSDGNTYTYTNAEWSTITSNLSASDIDDMSNIDLKSLANAVKESAKKGKIIKLSRFIKSNTKVTVMFVGGETFIDNIKIIGRFDDYNKFTYREKQIEKALGMSAADYKAATR